MRKHFFQKNQELKHDFSITNSPLKFYPQETDWTCSLACIRTIFSSLITDVPSENYLISNFNLKPGPHYSKEIKNTHILDDFDVIYGFDHSDYNFDNILELLKKNYFVMLESMYNYAHWFVLIGYFPNINNEIEKSKLLIYDPYYDDIRLLNTDEFITMWIDGNHEKTNVEHDFIAIKNKTKR